MRSEREKMETLLRRVPKLDFPGIVYVATRKQTLEVAEELRTVGLRAAAYHGGMRKAERHDAQERFMADQVDVMVNVTMEDGRVTLHPFLPSPVAVVRFPMRWPG